MPPTKNELEEQLQEAQNVADQADERAAAAEARLAELEAALENQPRGVESVPSSGDDKERIKQLEDAMRANGIAVPRETGPVRPMQVRAIARGYYGRLREPGGPAFAITSDKFSASWMVEVLESELSDEDKVAIAQEDAADRAAAIQAEAG
jgi:hypothetical protein